VGGKAASLARLSALGLPVPGFFVVTSAAFDRHLTFNKLDWPTGPESGPVDELRKRIARSPIPGEVLEPILASYAVLTGDGGSPAVAVRSSAAAEDSAAASFAGQFATELGVSGAAVATAIRRCWASCLSEVSLSYRRRSGTPLGAGPGFAVVVQRQVFAERAGVLFTRHPLEPEGGVAYLEANFGTGESVVGGLVTPDSFSLSRSTGKVVESRIGSKKLMTLVSESDPGSRVADTDPAKRTMPAVSTEEAERILALGMEIEKLTGRPQDVEWAFDASGLWILQARPQTGAPR
jgi:phosphoenolpyruvate synthase/pyruvate phosphate dikinase